MKLALPIALVLFAGCSQGPSAPVPVDDALVTGLRVTQVVAYQGLQSTLMKDGQPATPEVPLVVGRPTLVRVFVTPDDGWDGREVVVRLSSSANGADQPAMEVRRAIQWASADGDLDSTVNFELTGEQVTADLSWQVSLHEVTPKLAPASAEGASYPAEGLAPFGAQDTGVGEKVVVVPILYKGDGSGRMPDTSPAQLEALRARMLQLYPVRDVEITVGAPLTWSSPVSANGRGWGSLLDAVINRRLQDGAPSNVYYYGLFVPTATFSQYCGAGCVLGLSPASSDPDDEYARGSLGVGYPDKVAEEDVTFVHEVGHAHGRQHAPCMVDDPDPDYPYDDGKVGVFGYDASAKKLLDPAGTSRDMMGYCTPVWISDYTYKALFDRIVYLNFKPQAFVTPTRWRSIVIEDGVATRGSVVSVRRAGGIERTVDRTIGSRTDQVPARFYPFDHLPGGILLIPEDADTGTLRFEGRVVR